MTPFPGRVSIPSSFVSLFIFYILSYLLLKMMGCFSGHLISSASGQKLFCEACSGFKCSFNEFVGEKVVSPSYSSAFLAPPLCIHFHIILDNHFQLDYRTKFKWKHRNNWSGDNFCSPWLGLTYKLHWTVIFPRRRDDLDLSPDRKRTISLITDLGS